MKLTQDLRTKLKESRLNAKLKEKVLRNPIPESVLESKLVKRMADRTVKTLTRLSEVAEKGKAVKAVRATLKNRKTAETVRARYNDIRSELEKVVEPAKKAKAEKVSPLKKTTDKPMPEMIRAAGGKRLPAAVAKRAVRQSGTEFKAKKGQKKHH